jgi:hypothetical protein
MRERALPLNGDGATDPPGHKDVALRICSYAPHMRPMAVNAKTG